MPWVNVGHEQGGPINLHCDDQGEGEVVVLVHGWPVASDTWDGQKRALLAQGYRVVSYDRRSCGRSSAAVRGHDVDTYAEDLNRVLSTLALTQVTLVGHGVGAGEILRYLGSYGDARVRRCALIAPMSPTPLGRPAPSLEHASGSAERWIGDVRRERPECLQRYLRLACEDEKFIGRDALELRWRQALADTAHRTEDVLRASAADFRDDLHRIAVAMLILQGDADAIHPVVSAGEALAAVVADAHLVKVTGGPHALVWTHEKDVNVALSNFLRS